MLDVERRDNIAVLRMDHAKVNALDAEFLRSLTAKLAEIEGSDAEALVLTGNHRAFSAGANLPLILEGGAEYVRDNVPVLGEAFGALFSFPRPVVAAVNGHAIAGGCVLVCACDYKVMTDGDALVGIPELRVGVPFPTSALEIMRFAVGSQFVQQLVYLGEVYGPQEGMRRGLVDEVVAEGDVLARALEVAAHLASIPAETFALTKRALRYPVLSRIERDAPRFDPDVVRLWASDEVLASMQSFVDEVIGARRAAP
ncbi:MAG: enoyl-CoA hydratase/isomerase family protein [Actinomycetota bacterium]